MTETAVMIVLLDVVGASSSWPAVFAHVTFSTFLRI
jgi:hypothetical protein